MKKIFILFILAILLFSNCKNNDSFLFEMKYQADFSISAGLNPFAGTHIFEIENIPSLSDSYFAQNNRTEAEIATINPGTSYMSAIFSAGDFRYIRELSVKIFSKDDPSFEKEIFYHNQIPNNQSGDLQLIGTLVDAKEFLLKEDFGIRVELMLREITPATVDTRIFFNFHVK